MNMSWGLSHLFVTVFLFYFSTFMVVPAITDVCMEALCPGQDECSLAIYLTGVQQAIIGMGSLVSMPLIGNLSDHYGRKLLLTFPMMLAILPTVILAYSREREFFYAYFVLTTLTSMVCNGTVLCLAYAYVADYEAKQGRTSAFGLLSGVSSCSFVFGSLLSRFLPSVASVFQVSSAMSMVSLVYMRLFLPESILVSEQTTNECLIEKGSVNNQQLIRTTPSLYDSFSLLKRSWTFSQVAIVEFFSMLSEIGVMSVLMFYLKAEFQFEKDQFADLLIINGVAGIISQMILMPMLAQVISEKVFLTVGLASSCIIICLFAVAWSSWVIYVAPMLQIFGFLSEPSLRSIVSKLVGPTEQGKAQGCITGLSSFASIISPLVFSPLTALFLSDHAPFKFPGFSLMCAAFSVMIAFILSLMIKTSPSSPSLPVSKTEECDSVGQP